MVVVGAVITVAVKVECDTCGIHLKIDDVIADIQLTEHAQKHIKDDASFRTQFIDSPIIFPIVYNEILEETNG